MNCDLHGIGVLVTRPSGQGEALCEMITEYGGRPVHFPTTTIGPAEDRGAAKAMLQSMDGCQIVIFVSPNAVKYGIDLMEGRELPAEARICAVGKGTARALSERGIGVDVKPEERFDSESLLAMPELTEVDSKRILILRGNGGRTLLGETLRERGARVDYAEVYSRKIASIDAKPLISAWEREVDIVTATSCGILENLHSLLGEAGRSMLRETPLVVVSERIKARAEEIGCGMVVLADEASDRSLLAAICEWSENKH